MQREFKFKGLDVRTGKTVTGSLLTLHNNGIKGHIIVTNPNIAGKHLTEPEGLSFHMSEISVVYPDSVKQYTGLKDVLGNDIYEGDRVRYDKQREGQIVWYEPMAAFVFMFVEDAAYKAPSIESLNPELTIEKL